VIGEIDWYAITSLVQTCNKPLTYIRHSSNSSWIYAQVHAEMLHIISYTVVEHTILLCILLVLNELRAAQYQKVKFPCYQKFI
jgi:hypothetical protein